MNPPMLAPIPILEFDYKNQAWVLNGTYQDCGHPAAGTTTALGDTWEGCNCYGRQHAGEPYIKNL